MTHCARVALPKPQTLNPPQVDVEGYEPQALRSGAKLLTSRRIHDLLLEYSPGIPERHAKAGVLPFPRMLQALKALKYDIVDILGGKKHANFTWEGPLPVFKEVTEGNLKHDVDDVVSIVLQTMACPVPQKLLDVHRAGKSERAGCKGIPEDLHPKSFRSAFSHNTNIWASLGNKEMRKGPPVGTMSWSQSLDEYFVPEGYAGTGARFCTNLRPGQIVWHRCR
jgi:hypothetical protein